jgi:hypothetical protein
MTTDPARRAHARCGADPKANSTVLEDILSARSHLLGDDQATWLEAAPRPEGYAETMANSLEHAIEHPATKISTMPQLDELLTS